jgi:DNA-binding XRE family transcriptional regulator
MIGVKRQSVSAWETGVSGPTALQVAELAVVYCVSAHELLFGVEFQKVNIQSLVQSRALAQ